MRRIIFAMVIVGLMPLMLGAQTVDQTGVSEPSAAIVAATDALPAATVKRLRSAPDRFVQEAGRLIYGYGRDGAIDVAGLARFVARERAGTRARTLRGMLDADLNNDGAVSGDEIAARADTLAAPARGRLRFSHGAADLNRDGSVSWDEMRALAQLDAMDALTPQEEADVMGFMGFDTNKDAKVTVAEVQDLLRLFLPEL